MADSKNPGGEKSGRIVLFRGIKAEIPPETKGAIFVEDVIYSIFSRPCPALMSPVASRFGVDEALRRLETLKGTEQFRDLMDDHYADERYYSVFVSATEDEEEAAFFAGSGDDYGQWGLVARFRPAAGGYERYSPRFALGNYEEVLVAGGVAPETVDKVTLIGAGLNSPFTIHYIYRRMDSGQVEKFRSTDPERFHKLRGVRWSPETLFTRTP